MKHVPAIRLAARDALPIFVDEADPDDPPAVMVSFYVFDTAQVQDPIRTRAETVTWIRDRLHRVPHLRRRIHRVPADLDFPYWLETDVDPEHHIRFETIGRIARADLHRLLASMKELPLDASRPPWEVHVLTDVRGVEDLPESATIVALRLHHSVTDGLGAVRIARALFDDPLADPSPGGTPGTVPGVVGAALRLPGGFARLAVAVIASIRARRALTALTAAGTVTAPNPQRPRTRFATEEVGPQQLGRVRMCLRDVRAVARATGTSVNDVILSVVSGGLHDYLAHYGETPPASLAVTVPYAIRDRSDLESENKVTLMYVDLHTDHADPLVRLRRIHESANLEKQRVRRPEFTALAAPIDASPAVDLKLSIRRSRRKRAEPGRGVVPLANTVVTNVPRGTAEGLRFGDSPAVAALGTPMLNRNFGLVHAVSSLGDALDLTFMASVSSMPDPEEYERLLASAFAHLRQACSVDGDPEGVRR